MPDRPPPPAPPPWEPTIDLDGYGTADTAPDRPVAETCGRFRVVEAVGRGGMCRVVRGHDPVLRRDVALKQLHTRYAANVRVQRSIVDEAQITAQLDHPNIPPVHELTDDRGARAIAMKLVRGENFAIWLDEQAQRLPPGQALADALEVILKVCDAVAFAHARGVVHRDIKPENVLVGDFGEVYLMDWGLAVVVGPPQPGVSRVTISGPGPEPSLPNGGVVGTPAFMPPEQANGEPVDTRADIFGLGGLLYYALVRRPPYARGDSEEVIQRARRALWVDPAVIDPDVPPRLLRTVRRALALDPAQRFASAKDLGDQIRLFLRGGLHLPEVQFPAGARIVTEGEPGGCAYILTAGRVKVTRRVKGRSRFIRELGPGEVFGETAILGQRPRSATVEAVEPVTAHVVSRELLESELGLSSWVGLFTRALVDRFAELEERLDRGSGAPPASEPHPGGDRE